MTDLDPLLSLEMALFLSLVANILFYLCTTSFNYLSVDETRGCQLTMFSVSCEASHVLSQECYGQKQLQTVVFPRGSAAVQVSAPCLMDSTDFETLILESLPSCHV